MAITPSIDPRPIILTIKFDTELDAKLFWCALGGACIADTEQAARTAALPEVVEALNAPGKASPVIGVWEVLGKALGLDKTD